MNLTGQLRGHADRKHGWGRAQPAACPCNFTWFPGQPCPCSDRNGDRCGGAASSHGSWDTWRALDQSDGRARGEYSSASWN